MNLSYKIKKVVVRFKLRMKKKRNDLALKHMSIEQLKVFYRVKELAIAHNDSIKFDPASDEIIMHFPKLLITLKGETVYIHNTTQFVPMTIPAEAYAMLVEILQKEAHKERRKFKLEVKKRLNVFLDNIVTGIK